MSDTLSLLGKIITTECLGRDAVHIAVIPVIAGMTLYPGNRIGIGQDERAYILTDDENIGIVDPFLKQKVEEGQRFFLCLYPNSITSLRHVWTHPAFTSSAQMKRREKV